MAVLVLGLVGGGCGSDGGGGEKPDSGDVEDDDGGGPDRGKDGGLDSGGEEDADSGPCVPMGCDELGYECGEPEDGCEGILDCGNEGPDDCVDPNDETTAYFTCGGGEEKYKCGCTPKTCETLAPEGLVSCGETVDDGCGGTIEGGCGDCADKVEGEGWLCNTDSSVCECSPKSKDEACESLGRACGMATDGCGGTEYSCGSCSAARNCAGDGSCACKPQTDAYAATACAGKTCGTVVVDGCTFSCGTPTCPGACAVNASCASCECAGGQICKPGAVQCCSPATTPAAVAALCGDTCGQSVTDPCTGESVTCGCAAGQGCVDKSYVEGATKNVCLPANQASLLGGYVVRSHNFTALLGTERAESVSLAKIIKKANGKFQIQDQGCVATTMTTPSVFSAFFQASAAVAEVTLNGQSWRRETPAIPQPGGFDPAMPTFCAANPGGAPSTAPDYDVEPADVDNRPTFSSGSNKAWLDGPCTCPEEPSMGGPCSRTNMREACLPEQNLAGPENAVDCRINDLDRDGRPGFTFIAGAPPLVATMGSMAAAVAYGTLAANGSHVGIGIEPKEVFRHFFSCEGSFLCVTVASGAGSSHICGNDGNKFNRAEFRKLSPASFASTTCATFYNGSLSTIAAADSWPEVQTAVKQTAIDSFFNGSDSRFPLPACTTSATCAEGAICHSGKCWPMTTSGSCTTDAECNSNPKNATTAKWSCDLVGGGRSCWPAACPAPTGDANPG